MKGFVFTCGDPNGIGPEIILKLLNERYSTNRKFIFVVPVNVFEKTSKIVKPKFNYEVINELDEIQNTEKNVIIFNIPGGKISVGRPTKTSGRISFTSLNKALEIVKKNSASSIITAPISKEAWNLASIKYKGHTDFLGDHFGLNSQVMMFYSKKMTAALATVHIPIKNVSAKLTTINLVRIIDVVYYSLINDFNVVDPKIAVLGLNPHAGENGNIGNEEIETILPALETINNKNIKGPFVPDAFFAKKLYKNYNAVIGMYHDQVLIPFKLFNFDEGVNFTAGLPIVRTSPDHGTAFDIAYKGIANHKSLLESFKLAEKIVSNRNKNRR